MLLDLPEPSFIERDADKITREMIDLYELTTGKTLYPAQPERIFIDLIALREMQIRIGIQEAAKQNLVRYAVYPMLDHLGALDGCNRLAPQAAVTTLRVTLTAVQAFDVLIDAGTRRGTKDGKFVFATDTLLTIPAGAVSGDVTATAEVAGIAGNGYLPGDINVEFDLPGWVQTITNISESTGGADEEDDDHYRERIMLKPESYSSAGPELGYVYWTKSAHPNIVDVKAVRASAGVVNVYPLMSSGIPSVEILGLVETALSDKKRRPLTDDLNVLAPTEVTHTIVVAVTLYDWCTDDAATVKAKIETELAAYAAEMRSRLGADKVIDQIKSRIRNVPGVYKSVLTDEVDQVLADNEWLNFTSVTVTIAGFVRG